MPNDSGYSHQTAQDGGYPSRKPLNPFYFLGAAVMIGCAASLQPGKIAEKNAELSGLAQRNFREERHSPSAGTVTYVASYVDRAAYGQKRNSGQPLTSQDILVTIEVVLYEKTGTPVSLRVDAGHNGRLFDAGVDGLHHSLEPGHAPVESAAVDTLVVPAGNSRQGLDFSSNDPGDLETLTEAQLAANRFVQDTIDAIQGGGVVAARSSDFK
ncbi:hypothetical protein HYX09_04890 [Candidatus Woesearchaeota archaeon]|nr:hypothetical protein [Candidatus Woesearchaeota archaeon]